MAWYAIYNTSGNVSVSFFLFLIKAKTMCGRFCCALNPESVKNKLYDDSICKQKDIDWIDKDKYSASYNICPTRYIATMYQDRTRKQVLQSMVSIYFS